VTQRGDGAVAVQHLQHEQPAGDARRELALTPAMTRLRRKLIDVNRQAQTDLRLDLIQRDAKISSHPWPPVC
jgi:hypothetical protein